MGSEMCIRDRPFASPNAPYNYPGNNLEYATIDSNGVVGAYTPVINSPNNLWGLVLTSFQTGTSTVGFTYNWLQHQSLTDVRVRMTVLDSTGTSVTYSADIQLTPPSIPLLPGSFNLTQDNTIPFVPASNSYTFVGIGFNSMVSGGTSPYNYLLTDLKYAEVDASGNVGTFTVVTPSGGVPPSNFTSSANVSVNSSGLPITHQLYYWQAGVSIQTLRFEMTVTDSSSTPNSVTFTKDITLTKRTI